MKKQKILYIVGDPVGGIRKHIHDLILGLNPKLFEIYYVHSNVHVDEKFIIEIDNIRSKIDGEMPLKIVKSPNISDIFNIYNIIKFVVKNNIDIIHGHGAKGGMYARVAALVTAKYSIYTPHGGFAHNMFGFIENKIYSLIEYILRPATDCFVFESEYTGINFRSKVNIKNTPFFINYNGLDFKVDKDCTFPLRKNAPVNIGVFGMLRREKGQYYLINAIKNIDNVFLHVYGDGVMRSQLDALVSDLGLAERVIFHGETSDSEGAMADMDLIAIPSLFESFGYVGLEAVSAKKPVIASNVGGLKEIFTSSTAYLVPPGDSIAISDALVRLLNNRESIRGMTDRAFREISTKFTLKNMIYRIEHIYSKYV